MDYLEEAEKEFDEIVRMRRWFHSYPECGPEEQLNTLAFIEQELDKTGIRHQKIGHSGILAFINENKNARTILLRSDTDALPVQESEYNLSKKKSCVSKVEGVSHACGHDGHMAMLLVQAKILKAHESELNGSVLLLFEENEEVGLEIEDICRHIEDNKIRVDGCYGTHLRWDIPAGKVSVCNGIAMHGFCLFKIKIHGKGGHGSRPDLCNSPIDAFNDFYSGMGTLKMDTSSLNDRFTWSIGKINAGSAENVIPETLTCGGTYRFSNPDNGQKVLDKIRELLKEACDKNGCRFEFLPEQFMFPVKNDSECAEFAKKCITEQIGKEVLFECEPWMASETFSYLSNMFPSVYSFTGIQNEETGSGANHHTPEFDIDEKGLIYGTAMALCYTVNFLKEPGIVKNFSPAKKSLAELTRCLNEISAR